MKFTATIPNILTIFRVLLIPPILFLLYQDTFWSCMIAIVIYIISALTDLFDGMLARKLNQMSEFGAYFDPLADKLLIWGMFTVFSLNSNLLIPLWLISIIYLRDFFITFLRSYSRKKKINFKTSFVAKAKTTVQMVAAGLIMGFIFFTLLFKEINHINQTAYSEIWQTLLPQYSTALIHIPLILTILTVIFTIYTAVDYYVTFRKNKEDLNG